MSKSQFCEWCKIQDLTRLGMFWLVLGPIFNLVFETHNNQKLILNVKSIHEWDRQARIKE